jgi:hypothetical protein
MRRVSLLTAALAGCLSLVLGCGDEPTPTGPYDQPALVPAHLESQAVQHFTRRGPFEEDVTNPCTGGLVHFTGEIKEQQTVVGPDIHAEDQTLLTGTGTDPVNGVTYSIRRTFHFSFNSPSVEAANFTETVNTTVSGITPGPGANFLLHLRFHLTVLPSGEVATEVTADSAECRG